MEQIRRTILDAAAIDAKFSESEVLKPLVNDYTEGGRSLPQDIKDVLKNINLKSSDLSNVSLAILLN